MRPLIVLLAVSLFCVPGTLAPPLPGPDAFGYVSSEIPNNLRWINSSGTTLDLEPNAYSAQLPIGFTFNFYGVNYSGVYVSENGALTFVPGQVDFSTSGQTIPTVGEPDAFVAGFWTDLVADDPGTIFYETTGLAGSREMVVGFYDAGHWNDGGGSTFEMILHEGSNNIELQYGELTGQTSVYMSAGIENQDGTVGLDIYQRGKFPIPKLAQKGYLITSPANQIPEPATVSFVALGLAGLLYWRRRRV